MTEKVKVPKWFDEWYKTFGKSRFSNEDNTRLFYISRVGFGVALLDSNNDYMGLEYTNYVHENRKKLIRAILDGYEVEEEYIEIDPFEAYEYFYKGKDIYSDYKDKSNYNKTNISEFEPRNIKENNIIFYIKKENE